jgi:hypothetical protein
MRNILFIILFFFSIAFSQAQSFNAGLQFGMTGTQVTGDQLSGFHKAGLFGGAFVSHSAGRLGDFQLELNFIQKGSRKNAHPDKGDFVQYLMRLNYVALPIFYKFKLRKTLSLELGAEFAYLINSKEFDEYGLISPLQGQADFKDFDLSGFAGIGVNFKPNFRFVFRYSYSILPIRPQPDQGFYYYDAGQFNEVLIASIQYQF